MSETTLTTDDIQAIRARDTCHTAMITPAVPVTPAERDALCAAAERAETLEAEVAKWNKCDSLVCPYEQRAMQAEAQLTEVTRERDAQNGTLTMIVDRLGGTVAGRPTARVNFLQRIDELRDIESRYEAAIDDAEAWRALQQIDATPFTEAELAEAEQVRAKMKRTVEEYDIYQAVRRAESAESALAPLRAVVEAAKDWPMIRILIADAWMGAENLRTNAEALARLQKALDALPADPAAPTPR